MPSAKCRRAGISYDESLERVRVQSCVEIGSICYPSVVRKLAKETEKARERGIRLLCFNAFSAFHI